MSMLELEKQDMVPVQGGVIISQTDAGRYLLYDYDDYIE